VKQFFSEFDRTDLRQILTPPKDSRSLGESLNFIENSISAISEFLRGKLSSLGAHVDKYLNLLALAEKIKSENSEFMSLFKWYNGPLVTAMKHGDIFLIDEISLSDLK
jgi:midasin (ATPase involved in ribosome maturation)